jgi:Tfp pilus assembly protein PilF
MRLYALAHRRLDKAIEIDPSYYGPYELLGLYYRRFGDKEKAEDYIRKSVRLAPSEEAAWPWCDLAIEAEEAVRQAVSLKPRFPMFHLNFSIFLRNSGRIDESDRESRIAQQLSNETGIPLELHKQPTPDR